MFTLKTAVHLVLMGAMISCNSSQKDAKENVSEMIEKRVEAIYSDVVTTYNREAYNSKNFDSLYCTTKWNESMKEFALAESSSNEEMAFLDYDYWCYCQDFKDLKFENIKVTEVKDGKATVSLDLYNFGTKHSRILEMAFERGDWYIDNIIDFDGNSREDFMQGIKDYIDSMK